MAEEKGRTLNSEEDMLALAEELAARCPVRVDRRYPGPLAPWQQKALWFLGGAGAASVLWWVV